jgi:hypothetical protein
MKTVKTPIFANSGREATKLLIKVLMPIIFIRN